ncbi:hypothetical protein [Sphingobium algorifonticola]|nr:hypothetical protein [Sphingobium algorifonticola]
MTMFRRKLAAGLCAVATSLVALSAPAQAGTLFMGSYPNAMIVFDESKGAVTSEIKLETGLPTSMRLSNDGKYIYTTTITTSGIEVIDVATRKVVNKFSLNTPTTRYRFNGGVPDPTGRYFYTIATQMDKEIDRYIVGKPRYAVIDLQQKKIVRTAEIEAQDEPGPNGGWRTTFMVSDDGKSLYLFRDKVFVINVADLKVVDRIDLSKPETTGMENVGFGGGVEAIRTPGQYVSLFNAADPYVHNKIFGVARFDLAKRAFAFTPIGPAPASMAGLQVTPDGKDAYTVVTNGTLGNKRCEIWRFDMATTTLVDKAEFECRSRFQFGMSQDAKKLYIYGASYDVEVYDAKTLKLEQTWDLGNDTTGAGMVVVP